MIRVFRWIEKYCPHPVDPRKHVGSNPLDASAVGVRRLMGLAVRAIPLRPVLLLPAFLLATFYLWFQYLYFMAPATAIPPWLAATDDWLLNQPLGLAFILIPASVVAAWFLMIIAAKMIEPKAIGPKLMSRQFRDFLIASCCLILVSIFVNWIVAGISLDTDAACRWLQLPAWFSLCGSILNNLLFGSYVYYPYNLALAGPDLMAIGVSRGFVEGSILLAPLQVIYFLAMAAIIIEGATIRAAFSEGFRTIRSRPLQSLLLVLLTAFASMVFESALPLVNDLTLNWLPWTYLWFHNWSLSIFMMHTFEILSESLVGPVIVFYSRAFIGTLLILAAFYFYRGARVRT